MGSSESNGLELSGGDGDCGLESVLESSECDESIRVKVICGDSQSVSITPQEHEDAAHSNSILVQLSGSIQFS